jgi:hypothetical protein
MFSIYKTDSIFNTEFRDAFRRIIMNYIVREHCCNNCSRRQRGNSSRSGTEHHFNSDRCGHVVNATSHQHITPINNIPKRSSSCEILPIRDKIEIASNLSGGKITDI